MRPQNDRTVGLNPWVRVSARPAATAPRGRKKKQMYANTFEDIMVGDSPVGVSGHDARNALDAGQTLTAAQARHLLSALRVSERVHLEFAPENQPNVLTALCKDRSATVVIETLYRFGDRMTDEQYRSVVAGAPFRNPKLNHDDRCWLRLELSAPKVITRLPEDVLTELERNPVDRAVLPRVFDERRRRAGLSVPDRSEEAHTRRTALCDEFAEAYASGGTPLGHLDVSELSDLIFAAELESAEHATWESVYAVVVDQFGDTPDPLPEKRRDEFDALWQRLMEREVCVQYGSGEEEGWVLWRDGVEASGRDVDALETACFEHISEVNEESIVSFLWSEVEDGMQRIARLMST